MKTMNMFEIELFTNEWQGNRKAVETLIRNSGEVAGNIGIAQHLSALDNPGDNEHTIWVVRKDDRIVGWAAAGISLHETTEDACASLSLYAVFVQEEFRGFGIGSRLIERIAIDVSQTASTSLRYKSFEDFLLLCEEGDAAIPLEASVNATCVSEGGYHLTEKLSKSFGYYLEDGVDVLPYAVGEIQCYRESLF